jgi:hypothetical protein
LEEVSTTCDNGWVAAQLWIWNRVNPPAIAGGTDLFQAKLLRCVFLCVACFLLLSQPLINTFTNELADVFKLAR